MAAQPLSGGSEVTAVPARTSAPTSTTVARKPSALTTGVPAGTRLRVHRGDLVITKAGTHIDRMDIHGFVVVKAPRVSVSGG